MYLVLASKSPRRRDLLVQAGYNIQINASKVDETVEETDPVEKVMAIAKKKGMDIYNIHNDDQAVVLSADTIVVINNYILGKPKDKEDARLMIKMLQGNVHQVYTAVFIKSKEKEDWFYEKTDVYVSPMNDVEIEEYISTSEPYDKAGAYGIQGMFFKYISSINGDYYNVMGLPINKVREVLGQYSFDEKIYCLVCKHEVNKDDKFCNNCGSKIKSVYDNQICPSCHTLNNSKNKYCERCGRELHGKVSIIYNKNECMICHHVNKEQSQYCEACGALLNDESNITKKKNDKKEYTMTAFILSLVAMGTTGLGLGFISFIPGIVAVILSSIGLKNGYRGKNVLSLLFGILGILSSITYILFILWIDNAV